jgi:hypothetical protein
MQRKLLAIISVDIEATRPLSYILHPSDTSEKLEYNESVHRLFIDFKKAYDSVRREDLYKVYSLVSP